MIESIRPVVAWFSRDGMRRSSWQVSAFGLLAAACVLWPAAASGQGSCDVIVQLDEPTPQTFFAFGISYPSSSGAFIGNSTQPGFGGPFDPDPIACTPLAGAFFDALDDKAGVLSLFFADWVGLAGPLPLVSCVFEFSGGSSCPMASDFSIGTDAFPDEPIPPPPFPPVPALSIAAVNQRTAVCGDGFRETPEECDDGNTTDGDCCSAACNHEPQGNACDDGSVCTTAETCDGAGRCVAESTLSCDDGVSCTHDYCHPIDGCQSELRPIPPSGHCDHLVASRIQIRNHAVTDTADRFRFTAKLAAGGDIGDPASDTDYAVCVFDTSAGVPNLVLRLEIPAGSPWIPRGSSGFLYKDRARSRHGIEKAKLWQGSGGSTMMTLLGKGRGLPLPGAATSAQYLAQDPEVTVQIENSAGACWSESYDEHHGVVRHRPDAFLGRRR